MTMRRSITVEGSVFEHDTLEAHPVAVWFAAKRTCRTPHGEPECRCGLYLLTWRPPDERT